MPFREPSRKKSKCDEECLGRIAARLCSLDESSRAAVTVSEFGTAAYADSCCEKDGSAVASDAYCTGDKGGDSCCGGNGVTKGGGNLTGAGCCDEQMPDEKAADDGCFSGNPASPKSGCCGSESITKADDGCCGDDKTAVGCSLSEQVTASKSGRCSSAEKQSDKCRSNDNVDDACCPSGKAARPSSDDCCEPPMKPSGGCCTKDKVIDTCYTSEKPAIVSSACCATTVRQGDGCCGDRKAVSDGCSSGTFAAVGGALTAKQSSYTSALPKKTSCSIKGTSNDSHEGPTKSDCCSKSQAVKVQPMEDCSDGCCKEIFQEETASALSASFNNFQSTMERLEAMLKRGQCLCRRVQQQWGFNCCDPASIPAGVVAKKSTASPAPSTRGLQNKEKPIAVSTATSIHPRCSFDAPRTMKNRRKNASFKPLSNSLDVEKSSAREHVVLDVSGMTCTGCSKKMMNVLGNVTGLSNAQVTFVSGSAEFDLDPAVSGKVEDVLSRVEKETGFKCSRIMSGFQDLHVIMSPAVAKNFADSLPAGVVSVVKDKKKKDNYYITYNPRIVGARSVLPPNASLTPPQDSVGIAEGKRRLLNTALSTTLAAVLTIPVVVLEWSDNPLPPRTVEIVALVLGTGVQAIAIPEFYVGAVKSLIYSRVIEMDMLVVISIASAYLYSVVAFGLQRAGLELEQGPFFETSTLLITLVLLGRLMAAWARMKALSTVSLRSLQAETALLVGSSGEASKIDARLLQFGDSIVIPPHSRIVTDGTVTNGASDVDESMVIGESLPVAKQIGGILIAGTINGSGSLHVRLTRLLGDNSITDIARSVENAVAAKPRVQDLADRAASYFISVVVGISIIVFCIWVAVALEIRNRNGGGAVGLAITYGIAVLAISCPCALGLAIPMVLVIAGGVAARAGVVIKAADAIERSYKVTDVVFDKTGTLTEGDLQVVHTQTLPSTTLSEEEILSLGKAMVEGNEHPVSFAVASHLAGQGMNLTSKPMLESITSIPGAGIEAQYQGSIVKAGNPYWLNLEQHPVIAGLLEQAMTTLCIILNNEPILFLGLKSTIRANAASIIADLHHRGITSHIISGDNPAAVLYIAHTLGVARSNIRSRSSPSEKQKYVHILQASRKNRTVLFIGDGTNDAVAIAQSDVGVQMGSASDVTGAVSGVVLLSRDLSGLIHLLDLSRRAVRRIQFNFVWSFVYNLFAILLAAGAFVRVRVPPAYAGLGEIVSVGPVVLAAVSLVWMRK